ncbi:18238_t:CDS:2, partial [Dentiscutata erythropus]
VVFYIVVGGFIASILKLFLEFYLYTLAFGELRYIAFVTFSRFCFVTFGILLSS